MEWFCHSLPLLMVQRIIRVKLYEGFYLISYILGNHTRLKLSSKHLFIEVTATDLAKATIVLDTIVAMFSQYCEHPYS